MTAFMPIGLVSLTSDFCTADGSVGAMKGVMLAISPTLALHDIAHDIPAHDIVRGAATLASACPHFPRGTVHLAVVDPGVGTGRAAIVVVAGGHAFVGPDNGLLLEAAAAAARVAPAPGAVPSGAIRAWHISDHGYLPKHRSSTFHGRDLFAPTAAALAAGRLAPDALGPPLDPLTLPQASPSAPRGDHMIATIVGEDAFGNLITNLHAGDLAAWALGQPVMVRLPDGAALPLVRTFGDVPAGAPLALMGSDGRLEIAVRDGSARDVLNVARGTHVEITRVSASVVP